MPQLMPLFWFTSSIMILVLFMLMLKLYFHSSEMFMFENEMISNNKFWLW